MTRSDLSPVAAVLLALSPAAAVAADGTSSDYLCEDIKKPFFSIERLPGGRAVAVPGRERALPFSFAVPKEKGVFRLFVIGESAASILGVGDRAERVLGGFLSPGGLEAVNCGMGAYESRRILSVLEESLAYEPDLLVVLSGNNENGRTEICRDAATGMRRRLTTLKTRISALAGAGAAAPAGVSISSHESNLRAMARAARAKNVPLVFCTLPSNLRDYAPAGPLPDPVRPGVDLLYSGRRNEALAEFDAPGLRDDAFANFYAGRALEALGRFKEAASRYGAAVELDGIMDRCSPDRNAMIRRVAAEEGACIADLEKAFAGIARNGITGGEEIADGVHWFERYNPFVYAVIGEAAASCLSRVPGDSRVPAEYAPGPRSPAGGKDRFRLLFSYAASYASAQGRDGEGRYLPDERAVTSLERLYPVYRARLMKALDSPASAAGETLESDWDGGLKDSSPSWYPSLLSAAAEVARRAGRGDDAAGFRLKLRRAAAAAPPGGPVKPGERPAGEAEAKKLSDQAVAKITGGDLTEARALLEKAARVYPDGLETRLNACHLAALTREASFGEEHCGEAVSLALLPPKHAIAREWDLPSALSARAAFLASRGMKREACKDLRLALEKGSDKWDGAPAARRKLKELCR